MVTVDTNVKPKVITLPTSSMQRSRRIKRLARERSLPLRQSYLRIAKRAAMMAGHHATSSSPSAIVGNFRGADQTCSQQQRQREWKLYSFHAPKVECIDKGKASAPYELGVTASIVTTNTRASEGSSCCTPRHCRATHTTISAM